MTHFKTTSRAIPFPAWHFIALGSLAAAALALPATASADDMESEKKKADSTFVLGAGVAHVPTFEGSDEYKTRALPMINYRSGRFFAGALGGAGYNFSPVNNLQFGPLLSYRFGRDESDDERLRGLGDIDAGLDVGAFVRWNFQPFFVHATLMHGITGDAKGAQIGTGIGYSLAMGSRDRLVVDASVNFADKDVMQEHFGVTNAQASRSGLAEYKAKAGIRRYGVGVLWTHSFTPQWFSTVGAGVHRLGNEAADSPITVKRTTGSVSAGLGYRF